MEFIKLHKKKSTAVILLVIVIACFAVFKLKGSKEEPITIGVMKVESVQSEVSPRFSGKLEALESSSIVSKSTGKVGDIRVDIGSIVKAGDVLLTLEASELLASVDQAQAAVQLAYSNRQQDQIDYQAQKINYDRNKILLEQGALSPADFENKFEVPFKKAEELALHGADAQVRQAQANLQLAQANYNNSIIIAPINGIITAKNINTGELASPGVTLFFLVNLDKVFVMASVGEDDINQVKTGMQIPVQVESASESPFVGTVTNVAQAGSPTTKTFPVKIQIDNPNHILKPGMLAEVLWISESHTELAIPREALINEKGQTYVWTLNNGTVSKKEVVTEALDETRVGIKAGLDAGQEVVISGQDRLREGIRVESVKRV